MGYTVPVSFAVGDAMNPTQVQLCLTDARTWLNGGIESGDVSGLRGDRLYGVDHYGFPLQGGRGTVRESGGRARDSGVFAKRDRMVARQDIFVEQVQADGYVPILGLCATRFVQSGAAAEVVASWWAGETHDYASSAGAGAIVYPKDAGEFVFRYRDRGDTSPSWTTVSAFTYKLVSHREALQAPESPLMHAIAWFTNSKSGGSVYDFGFFYSRANANSGVKQVSVSRPQMAFTLTRV